MMINLVINWCLLSVNFIDFLCEFRANESFCFLCFPEHSVNKTEHRAVAFGPSYSLCLVLNDLEQATSVMTQIGYAGSLG